MQLKIKKELYSKQVILKAAYHFTDSAYIYLDCSEDEYIVSIKPKKDASNSLITADEFSNELIAQAARESVFMQSEEIRKLILGRAFASTLIEDNPEDTEDMTSVDDDSLFEDWYDEQR